MSDLDVIAPQKVAQATFSLEPAHNALTSIALMIEQELEFDPWIQQTVSKLTPEQLQLTDDLVSVAFAFLDHTSWPSFPAWLDHVADTDPSLIRDRPLERLVHKAAKVLNLEVEELPSTETLLADRESYLSLLERLYATKGTAINRERYIARHASLNDPEKIRSLIVDHGRWMWEEHLQEEWTRRKPSLEASRSAFERFDFTGMSATELITSITGRDQVPDEWQMWTGEIDQLIFIPSPHIGAYLLLIDHTDTKAWIAFGARIPKGAGVRSPELNRSELHIRLAALADDTRLRILQNIADAGELGAKDIMSQLDLSQSAASRHLRQLSVTGYLLERRAEGGKYYRLNYERVQDTIDAMGDFFR
jgi:DNA-binding transcriptional ArsR family regulator